MLTTDYNSVLTTRNVTAVLPYHGAVAWPEQQLDRKAAEWMREHASTGHAWQIPWLKPSDGRACTGCPNNVPWQNCQYALWARMWRAQRLTQGIAIPGPDVS